jgi:hypothetical protein
MSVLGFLLKGRLMRGGKMVLEELKYRIETGKPHPNKLKAVARVPTTS